MDITPGVKLRFLRKKNGGLQPGIGLRQGFSRFQPLWVRLPAQKIIF